MSEKNAADLFKSLGKKTKEAENENTETNPFMNME